MSIQILELLQLFKQVTDCRFYVLQLVWCLRQQNAVSSQALLESRNCPSSCHVNLIVKILEEDVGR